MRTIKRLKLKELREDYNIPQADLASKAGVTQSFLSMVESGRRGASDKLKKVLIDHFNVDNLEEYEIEVVTDDGQRYSFANNGQYIDGQTGGTSNYYDMKVQATAQQSKQQSAQPPVQPQEPSQTQSTSQLEVMTSVVKDYLDRNIELQQTKRKLEQENEELKSRLQEAEERIALLENEVKRLKNNQDKTTNN